MNFRKERISKLLMEELNRGILREVEFVNTLVTITDVEVSSKMETAKVKFSAYPSENAADALKTLREARPRLQHLLTQRLRMKIIPKIDFEIDHGPEKAAIVEKITLEEVE